MTIKRIENTKYITDDGREWPNAHSALAHENRSAIRQSLADAYRKGNLDISILTISKLEFVAANAGKLFSILQHHIGRHVDALEAPHGRAPDGTPIVPPQPLTGSLRHPREPMWPVKEGVASFLESMQATPRQLRPGLPHLEAMRTQAVRARDAADVEAAKAKLDEFYERIPLAGEAKRLWEKAQAQMLQDAAMLGTGARMVTVTGKGEPPQSDDSLDVGAFAEHLRGLGFDVIIHGFDVGEGDSVSIFTCADCGDEVCPNGCQNFGMPVHLKTFAHNGCVGCVKCGWEKPGQ